MTYQVLWSELTNPEFTEEDKDLYKDFKLSQVHPVGNVVEGRAMFHAIGTIDSISSALELLKANSKKPKIIRVSDKENTEYGYVKIVAYTEEEDSIKESVTFERDEERKLFSSEDDPHVYLQPKTITVENEKGESEELTTTPAVNCFAGWVSII